MNFKKLISGVNSWAEFKTKLGALSKQDKGLAFEELTKYYLKIDTRYKDTLKDVWLLQELRTTVRKKLNLPSNDQGIDLIAETKEGTYWAIQCKYLQEENQRLSHRAISTFTSLSKGIAQNIAHCLVATTADDYASIYKGIKNIGFINAEEWNRLNKEFFTRVRALLSGKEVIYKPSIPRKHQVKAIAEAKDYFLKQGKKRGKLVFPCGAGKSLTGYWLKKELKSSSTIVAVPSLSLVKQTLEVYLNEAVANKEKIDFLCVCSDEGIGKNDDVVVHTSEIGVPCVTDVKYIAQWLKDHSKGKTVIFTTYQSGKTIAQAARLAKVGFDLGIMDEAHKTVGSHEKLFSHLLFEKNIRIARRIFMTATERRYAGSSDNILSMDDVKVYGDTFTQMPFKEAINSGILSDYKIITLFISDSEVKNLISKNAFVKPQGKEWDKETEARTLAAMIALRKAMMNHPIHHAVTFHSSIKKAEAFDQSQEIFSRAFPAYKKVDSFHVSGAMATSHRSKVVREFTSSRKAIITNAKCLTEGVDVPKIDCVLFADPRKSTVDVVQAVGRALRRTEGKRYGYVILPVFTKSKKKEEIIESPEFKEILTTLRALASNDERIIEFFQDKGKGNKSGAVGGDLVQFDIDERIIESIDEKELIDTLELKTWNKLAKLSWMPFEEARECVRELKLKNNDEWREYSKSNARPLDIPAAPERVYRNIGWTNWGEFLGTGNIANYYKDYISYTDAKNYLENLRIKSGKEFHKLKSLGKIPNNIPSSPDRVYRRNGWISWGDFLNSKFVATNRRIYVSYKDAVDYAKRQNIKSTSEWEIHTQSNSLPTNIPKQPNKVYANSGWVDWPSFFGKKRKYYLSYLEAKATLVKEGIKYQHQYWKKSRSGELEKLPQNPAVYYKDKGWISWNDFLSQSVDNQTRYITLSQLKNIVSEKKVKSVKQWKLFLKNNKNLGGIPTHPQIAYLNNGWTNWADFFGTKNYRVIEYLPFKDARSYVRNLKLKNNAEWRAFSKSRRPKNIPGNPPIVYKDKGWISWADFLGNGNERNINYLSYERARNLIRKVNLKTTLEWRKYSKISRPKNIPSNPDKTYLNNGWKGWADFLGKDVNRINEKEL